MAPKMTSREKQEDFRARQALLGHKEVRGIYLPEALHPFLKEQAQKLLNDPRPAKCCAGERGPQVAQKCVTCPYAEDKE